MDMPPSPLAAVHGGAVILMNTNHGYSKSLQLRDVIRGVALCELSRIVWIGGVAGAEIRTVRWTGRIGEPREQRTGTSRSADRRFFVRLRGRGCSIVNTPYYSSQ